MSVSLSTSPSRSVEDTPRAPGWVRRLVGPSGSEQRRCAGGLEVSLLEGRGRALVSAVVPGARELSRRDFEDVTTAAYEAVRKELAGLAACHPLRLWNFIPELLSPIGDLPHRYMAFNTGRYRSFSRWFDHGSDFARHVPTATGVGHEGSELRIQCLSCTSPGTAVENPRQISSYRYSEKFGPLPPCFSRATWIGNSERPESPPWLLVGGTASVLGEESIHSNDLISQARETFINLAAVTAAGLCGTAPDPAENPGLWNRYRHLRIYYVRNSDLPVLRGMVESRFQTLDSVEYHRADLCRPELLVEIEGVAELDTTGAGGQ